MNTKRRTVLRSLGIGVVAISAPCLNWQNKAIAADLPKLDLNNPTAQALAYVHETQDTSKPCSKCQLYTGAPDSEWGPCTIFPGTVVNANGWCKSWIAKTG